MARKGYYHGDEFIEYKRGNLAGQYGTSSKNRYAEKTVYNSGTYYKSWNNHKSSHKTENSNPDFSTSKKGKNSFLTSDNQYSKRLESNKCIFCGKEYNRNIYMLCPYCYIECSRCGRKYNTKLHSSCPDCGSSNGSYISNNSTKRHEKSAYNDSKIKFNNYNLIKCPKCHKLYTNIHSSCPYCQKSKSIKSSKQHNIKSTLHSHVEGTNNTFNKCPICGKLYNNYETECPYCKKSKNIIPKDDNANQNLKSNSNALIIGICLSVILIFVVLMLLL